MKIEADVAVIGAGMAGVSVAHELSADATVVLLEQENQAAYHTTGRSAAMFLESYGGPAIRAFFTWLIGHLPRKSRPLKSHEGFWGLSIKRLRLKRPRGSLRRLPSSRFSFPT